MRVFTKEGAVALNNEFKEMCKKFAEKNGIEFSSSKLTYGDQLSFSVKFAIEENVNAEWEAMVRYFKSQGANLVAGGKMIDEDKGAVYTVTGKLNTGKSKFKIELISSGGKSTYGTVDWVLRNLK